MVIAACDDAFAVRDQVALKRGIIIAVAAALVGVLAGGSVLAFGPVVRARVAEQATRRGFVVSVGRVRAGWLRGYLDGVTGGL